MSNGKRRYDATGEETYADPPEYVAPGESVDTAAETGGDAGDELGDFAYPDPGYAQPAYAAPATETHAVALADDESDERVRPSVGDRMAELRDRIRGALASLDRGPTPRAGLMAGTPVADDGDEGERTEAIDVLSEVPPRAPAGRFPVTPLGYNRAAVDEYVAELEQELDARRDGTDKPEPAISITEELERIGEQTASILVTAHDKAHETTRLANEQAEQRLADAATDAAAMTDDAKRRLEALDMETDAVWQERARLLEDARATGNALIALIDEAERRLPEELRPADVEG